MSKKTVVIHYPEGHKASLIPNEEREIGSAAQVSDSEDKHPQATVRIRTICTNTSKIDARLINIHKSFDHNNQAWKAESTSKDEKCGFQFIQQKPLDRNLTLVSLEKKKGGQVRKDLTTSMQSQMYKEVDL